MRAATVARDFPTAGALPCLKGIHGTSNSLIARENLRRLISETVPNVSPRTTISNQVPFLRYTQTRSTPDAKCKKTRNRRVCGDLFSFATARLGP